MEKGYSNIGFYLIVLIPITIFGFLKTYLGQIPFFENDPGTDIHFHFAISALWIMLVIIQPILIHSRKFKVHRILGRLSYFLFFLLLISFIPLYAKQVNGGFLPLIMLTSFDILLLIFYYSLAIYYKKRPFIHMRYMIVLALVFMLPALGRINSHWVGVSFRENMTIGFGFVGIILLLLALKDKINGNTNHRPYLMGLAGFTLRHLAIYFSF